MHRIGQSNVTECSKNDKLTHTLAISVVVWRAVDPLFPLVEDLLANTVGDFHAYVHDNGNPPSAARRIAALASDRVTVSRSERNLGFGSAHNLVTRSVSEDAICYLNPDMRVMPEWNVLPLRILFSDPWFGAVGPFIHSTAWYFAGLEWIPYVNGSCVFMRVGTARDFGPFDGGTFPYAYCEDTDLSLRLVKAGYRLGQFPSEKIHHFGNWSRRYTRRDVVGRSVQNFVEFQSRWTRNDPLYRVLRLRYDGIGDTLALTPSLPLLHTPQDQRPLVHIGSTPEALIGNPHAEYLLTRHMADCGYVPDGGLRNWRDCHDIELHTPYGRDRSLADVTAKCLDVKLPSDQPPRPRYYPSSGERQWTLANLPSEYIAICMKGSSVFKQYPYEEDMARLLYIYYGVPVVALGNHRPEETINEYDLRGKTTMREACAIVEQARFLVSTDSGLMHVAAAVGTPTLSVFGHTKSRYFSIPELNQHGVDTPLACGGCWHRQERHGYYYCMRLVSEGRKEFGRETPPCLHHVKPTRVLDEAKRLFPRSRKPAPAGVTVSGIRRTCGYSQHAALWTLALDQVVADVRFLPLERTYEYADAYDRLDEIQAKGFAPAKGYIHACFYSNLHQMEGFPNLITGIVGEGDPAPRRWVRDINRLCVAHVSPARDIADSFRNGGLRKPLYLIHLPADTFFRYGDDRSGSVFRFGSAGTLGSLRKGLDILINAFQAAFPKEDDVRLELKNQWHNDWVATINDPRIIVHHVLWDKEDLRRWYHRIHCYVAPHRGEGWGFPIMEAMQSGCAVIATNWGGPAEFLDPEYSYPLSVKRFRHLNDGQGPYLGMDECWRQSQFPEPDLDEVAHRMRYAYEHWSEASEKGRKAAKTVPALFAPERIGEELLNMVNEVCA